MRCIKITFGSIELPDDIMSNKYKLPLWVFGAIMYIIVSFQWHLISKYLSPSFAININFITTLKTHPLLHTSIHIFFFIFISNMTRFLFFIFIGCFLFYFLISLYLTFWHVTKCQGVCANGLLHIIYIWGIID